MGQITIVDQNNWTTEVANSKTPVLVDFFAEWCGPCRMMVPVLEKAVDKLSEKVKITKLNTDQNPDLSTEFGISSIPCMIIFQNGKEKTRTVGYHSEQQLLNWIETSL